MTVTVIINGEARPVGFFYKCGKVTAIRWNGARVTVRNGKAMIDGAACRVVITSN